MPEEKSDWKVPVLPPPLSIATAEALVSRWRGPRRIADVVPLEGGLMNRNYRIRFAGGAEAFVLRFFDRDPAACAKEAAVLAMVRRDVPVPHVLHVEPDGADGFPPFMVLEFIDGISLRDLKSRGDARAIGEAAYDAGRLLAPLSRHRFDRSGLLTPLLSVASGPFEDVTTAGVVELFAQSPVFRRRVDARLLARLARWAQSCEQRVGVAPGASLAHGDFNSPNIFVRRHNGRWTVAALLDWEFAFAGSPYSDIGNMLRYERRDRVRYEPHFSRGCIDGGLSLPDDW